MLKFVHITKNGGSSIEEVGKKHDFKWGRYDTLLKNDDCYIKTYEIWHVPLKYFKKSPYNKQHILFTVVRNPYDRIISECFCKWGGKFKNKEFENINEFNEYINIRVKKHLDFEFFHFIPQHLYTHDYDGNQIVNFILKFENLTEEFNDLMKKFNLNIKLNSHTNKSNKKFGIKDISPENIKLINEVYDKDFLYYKYPKIII